jgi:hypothetical protein
VWLYGGGALGAGADGAGPLDRGDAGATAWTLSPPHRGEEDGKELRFVATATTDPLSCIIIVGVPGSA